LRIKKVITKDVLFWFKAVLPASTQENVWTNKENNAALNNLGPLLYTCSLFLRKN